MIYLKLGLILCIILLSSYCLGSFFSSVFLKKLNFPRITLGFFAILAISQLFLWYPMFRTYDSIYLIYNLSLLAILSFSAFIYLLIFNRKCLLVSKRECLQLLSIIVACFVITLLFVEVKDGAPDSLYYIGNMMENAGSSRINTFSGFTGLPEYMNRSYAYQSFYLVIAGLGKLLRVSPYLISLWVLPSLVLITTYEGIYYLIQKKNYKNWLFYVLTILYLCFSYEDFIYACNGASYKLSLFIFIYLLIEELFQSESMKDNIKYMFVLTGFMLAGISVHSSILFQGMFILCGMIAVAIILKYHNKIIYLFMPVFALIGYACFYLQQTGMIKKVSILIFLFYIFYLLLARNKKILSIILKSSLVLVFIGLLIGGLFLHFQWGPFIETSTVLNFSDYFMNFLPEKLQFSMVLYSMLWFCLFVSVLLYSLKYKNTKIESLFSLIVFIFIFNPIMIGFISTLFTREVYFRIDEIFIKNPYFLFAIFSAIDFVKFKKYSIPFIFASSLMIIGSFDFTVLTRIKNIHPLYRIEKSVSEILLNTSSLIDKIQVEDYKVSVMSTDLRLRYFTNKAHFYLSGMDYRYLYSDYYILSLVLYRDFTSNNPSVDLDLLKRILQDNKISAIVMDNNQTKSIYDSIEGSCEISFKNKDYRLYYCSY